MLKTTALLWATGAALADTSKSVPIEITSYYSGGPVVVDGGATSVMSYSVEPSRTGGYGRHTTANYTAIARHAFTASDAVSMSRIQFGDVAGIFPRYTPKFHFSPDGSKVLFVLWRGNLDTGLTEYDLILLRSKDVIEYINGKNHVVAPEPRRLARFSTSSISDDGIQGVVWVDDHSAAFIGREAHKPGQVFLVDTDSSELRQVSHQKNDIKTFGMSPAKDLLIFSAFVPPDWSDRNAYGFTVASETVFDVTKTNPADAASQNIKYFIERTGSGKSIQLSMEPGWERPGEISISPNGRWAVIPNTVRKIPSTWSGYKFMASNPTSLKSQRIDGKDTVEIEDAFGSPKAWLTQYYVIDTESAAVRPLLDAPTFRVGSDLRLQAKWAATGDRVVLPPTYLPLVAQAPRVSLDRTHEQAIVVVEFPAGTYSIVDAPISSSTRQSALTLVDTDWVAEGLALTYLEHEPRGPDVLMPYHIKSTKIDLFKKSMRRWDKAESSLHIGNSDPGGSENGRLMLQEVESLNTAPEVFGIDMKNGRRKQITRLNPQFENLSFGHVEEFRWVDSIGREFVGGLVFPPSYDKTRRYPVVMQANGFNSQRFLVDGELSGMTPHSAQALANRGLIVLQLPMMYYKQNKPSKGHCEDLRETGLFMIGAESAIESLDRVGVADVNRIGILGFSREGMRAHHAVTYSRYHFAAALIADSVSLTPSFYASLYGRPYPGMAEFELDDVNGVPVPIGAAFWGQGIRTWMERSYFFHLDRITTPIRYEGHGDITPPSHWEVFAILKRMHRPVEMFHIPMAQHSLKRPFARYASQEGAVDWFDFWLNAHEDPAPGKSDQYVRWRKLRADYEQLKGADEQGVVNKEMGQQCTPAG